MYSVWYSDEIQKRVVIILELTSMQTLDFRCVFLMV